MTDAKRLEKVADVLNDMAVMSLGRNGQCPCGGLMDARAKACPSCLRVAADALKARVAELETGGGLLGLWWFLNDNPDQPMPPGANPCKQAIEAIQALRAERDRLAEIVERLPKTRDGVPVTPWMHLWVWTDDDGIQQDVAGALHADSYNAHEVTSTYSTRAAAEAARAKGGT